MQIKGTFIIFSTETEGNRYNLSGNKTYYVFHLLIDCDIMKHSWPISALNITFACTIFY